MEDTKVNKYVNISITQQNIQIFLFPFRYQEYMS